jgi:hypothetical protein
LGVELALVGVASEPIAELDRPLGLRAAGAEYVEIHVAGEISE